ncbi:hypothetical protein [Embleya sp. NPDC059237]|uniref:hypothetical protein n=1 Tax=Embleya sp. NPDC059237 TaxID=3346784 RepID=UPI0036BA2DCD
MATAVRDTWDGRYRLEVITWPTRPDREPDTTLVAVHEPQSGRTRILRYDTEHGVRRACDGYRSGLPCWGPARHDDIQNPGRCHTCT